MTIFLQGKGPTCELFSLRIKCKFSGLRNVASPSSMDHGGPRTSDLSIEGRRRNDFTTALIIASGLLRTPIKETSAKVFLISWFFWTYSSLAYLLIAIRKDFLALLTVSKHIANYCHPNFMAPCVNKWKIKTADEASAVVTKRS